MKQTLFSFLCRLAYTSLGESIYTVSWSTASLIVFRKLINRLIDVHGGSEKSNIQSQMLREKNSKMDRKLSNDVMLDVENQSNLAALHHRRRNYNHLAADTIVRHILLGV